MSTETSKLPDKPNELILVALKDLRAAEESEKYDIYMEDWHGPPTLEEVTYKCEVCFAGAVMAFSLEGDINSYYQPCDFPGEEEKLFALDYFRRGHVGYGLREFYYTEDGISTISDEDAANFNCDSIHPVIEIPNYHDDREGFHEAMKKLADLLKKEGY